MFRRNFLKSALAFVGVGAIESPIKAISKEEGINFDFRKLLPADWEIVFTDKHYAFVNSCDEPCRIPFYSYYNHGENDNEIFIKLCKELTVNCNECEKAHNELYGPPQKKIIFIKSDIRISKHIHINDSGIKKTSVCGCYCGITCYNEKPPEKV